MKTFKKENQMEILELKSKISEVKSSLDSADSRLQRAEERVVNFKRDQKIVSNLKNRKKNIFKRRDSTDLWDNIILYNLYVSEVPEREEREMWRKIFKEIMASGLLNFLENINLQISPRSSMNPKQYKHKQNHT